MIISLKEVQALTSCKRLNDNYIYPFSSLGIDKFCKHTATLPSVLTKGDKTYISSFLKLFLKGFQRIS